MKILFWAGMLLLVLGIVFFFVPLPRNEARGVEAGDVKIAVKATAVSGCRPLSAPC